MKRLFFTVSIISLASAVVTADGFNFSQELNKTNELKNTIEFITSYQAMAQQVGPEDSSRLAKKLVKLIASLHTICYEEEDQSIKLAYKNLLETALKNEKLISVDYTKDLESLLAFYIDFEIIVTTTTAEPVLTDTLVITSFTESLITNSQPVTTQSEVTITVTQSEAPTTSETARPAMFEKLHENTKKLNRNTIVPQLMVKRIINDVTKITRELGTMQGEIAGLYEQNYTLAQMYKKLVAIERLITAENLTRSPSDGELEEYSPLLKKLIVDELQS